MKILNTVFDNVVHFFYPTYCLHCDCGVEKPHHLLCAPCFEQIEWIDRKERCPRCWGPHSCKKCGHLHPHRSLFEPCGPILQLHQEFLKTKRGKTLAALIVIAIAKTSWPLPEVIVPFVNSPFPKGEAIYFLAKELAAFLNVSIFFAGPKIEDKKILLLTDTLWKTEDLVKEKQRVSEFFPEKIFTLSLIDQRN